MIHQELGHSSVETSALLYNNTVDCINNATINAFLSLQNKIKPEICNTCSTLP